MRAGAMLLALVVWSGTLLVLSDLPRMQRPGLVDRLSPYVPGSGRDLRGQHRPAPYGRRAILSLDAFREVLAPLCEDLARRALRTTGVTEGLRRRLEVVHSADSPADVRLRQFVWGSGSGGVVAIVAIVLGAPVLQSLVMVAAGAAGGVIAVERSTVVAAERHRREVLAELAVVAEQLAMLLSAGYSLNAALARLAERGSGATSSDLARVCGRIRQGLTTAEALREWAEVAEVGALDRLVSTLALERDAVEIAQLVSDEARAVRDERQQRLIEDIERRNQKVWIPVTVAALVPGILFLAVPFIDALDVIVD